MKKLFIVITILFLILIIHSKELYRSLVEDGDYYRAAGAYKTFQYTNGIKDTSEYYLTLAAIYALSPFDSITDKYYNRALILTDKKDNYDQLSVIKSYMLFKSGDYENALFEIESIDKKDSLYILMQFFNKLLKKDNIMAIPIFLPDSIEKNIKAFRNAKYKSVYTGEILSTFLPGLGEWYGGDKWAAIRDFSISMFFSGVLVYGILKNNQSFAIDRFQNNFDYIKSRDWGFILVVYYSFVQRFLNGSKVNAAQICNKYNEVLYERYLTDLYYYINSFYYKHIMNFID